MGVVWAVEVADPLDPWRRMPVGLGEAKSLSLFGDSVERLDKNGILFCYSSFLGC